MMHYIEKDPDYTESELEDLRNQIQSLDKDQVFRLLNRLEAKWSLRGDNMNPSDILRLGYGQFFNACELSTDGFPKLIEMKTVDGKRQREVDFLKTLGNRTKELMITADHESDHELNCQERVCRLIKQVGEAFKNIRTHFNTQQRIQSPREVPDNFDCDPDYFNCTPMDDSKLKDMSPYQRAIVACLEELYNKQMRRYKGQCCVQRKSEGQYTRAWKPMMTIPEFVYTMAEKEVKFDVWRDLTARGTAFRDVINHLTNCNDVQFPEIEKNRHMWSFKNGVFIGKEWIPEKGLYESKFYAYDSKEFRCLDPTLVACKYFDQPFDDYSHVDDWWDIPTPHFDSILRYQQFDDEVMKWVFIMGGRLCFDTGDMDGWQIIPFFKGIARSGKSTVVTKVFRKFYDSEDVRTLSNNIERQFGLSSIYDGFMFISPEIKGDLRLEQAEFQSLVSGEDVSVAVKHQNAISIQWKTPGCLAGNEVPSFRDNSGSVLRRLLTWNFKKQVKDADPTLDTKLNDELPRILSKCVRAYLEYSQKYRNKDIWNIVPKYFLEVQGDVAKNLNALEHFLNDSSVRFGDDLCIPEREFKAKFKQHCVTNSIPFKFNKDVAAGPFSSRDIEIKKHNSYRGQVMTEQEFVFGLDIVEETMGTTDF